MKVNKKQIKATNSKKLINIILLLSEKYLYLILCIFVICASLLFCNLYISKFPSIIDNNNNLIFSNIQFGHGPLINNLVFNNVYEGQYIDRTFIMQKMPVLPIFIYILSNITHNFYILVIFKNLIMFFILFFFIKNYLQTNNLNLKNTYLLFSVYLVPYNMFVSLNFEYADCIISILLPCLFLCLMSKNRYKYFISTLLLFFLYLTKNSMLFVCIILPLYILLFEKNKSYRYQKLYILCGPLIAAIIWASFSYVKTGRLAIGSSMLSVNSMGMNIALNEDFLFYFPKKSLDIIHYNTKYPENIENEWELSDYYQKKNREFFLKKENIFNYVSTFPEKIKFILFYINRDAALPDKYGNFDNSIRYSSIPNKLFINISILCVTFLVIKNLIKKKFNLFDDLLFLIIICSYSFPFIIAWSTSKHLVPLSILCFYFLIDKYFKRKNLVFEKTENIDQN